MTLEETLPLRTFEVTVGEDALNRGRVLTVKAHAAHTSEGHLQLVCYVGDTLWTLHIFAPGSWSHVGCSLPSAADVAKVVQENTHALAAARAMQQDVGETRN